MQNKMIGWIAAIIFGIMLSYLMADLVIPSIYDVNMSSRRIIGGFIAFMTVYLYFMYLFMKKNRSEDDRE